MEFIIKNDAREILKDFEIYKHEVFTIDDNDEERKTHYTEYYVWYNMLISFTRSKKNNWRNEETRNTTSTTKNRGKKEKKSTINNSTSITCNSTISSCVHLRN